MPVIIGGWQKASLLDYPGQVATTVFLQGCNFRCGFCHNPELVPSGGGAGAHSEQEVLDFLARRRKMLDGICFSGGEPLLQEGLVDLLQEIRSIGGISVKLDTNGSLPEILASVLQQELVDYVALDAKSPPENYGMATGGWKGDPQQIRESLHLLRSAGIEFELRTTVVPGLIGTKEIEAVCDWLGGSGSYVLQQFKPGVTLASSFSNLSPHPADLFQELARICAGRFDSVTLRGV